MKWTTTKITDEFIKAPSDFSAQFMPHVRNRDKLI